MSKLSTLLNAANREGWSLREISRRAQQRGHTLDVSTVSRYFSGRHGEPGEAVLRAFHEVLSIPMGQLREAAGVPTGVPGPYVPPDEADRLDLDQRQAVDQIIRLLARKQVTGNAEHPAPIDVGDDPDPVRASASPEGTPEAGGAGRSDDGHGAAPTEPSDSDATSSDIPLVRPKRRTRPRTGTHAAPDTRRGKS